MKKSLAILFWLVILPASVVHAQGTPLCHYEDNGTLVCTLGGGSGGGGGGGGGNGGSGGGCTPGEHLAYQITGYHPSTQTCSAMPIIVDNCTGQIIDSGGDPVDDVPCSLEQPEPQNPCEVLTVGVGGITCEATRWNLRARVSFPELPLDVRPYPVTLVRWPTAVRSGGLSTASGMDGESYVSYGGGSPGNPEVGDWRDLRLILSLRPAGLLSIELPRIGTLDLPDQGPSGMPRLIQWEVPSHSAAGGGPLAGTIRGLDELPADLPVFVGQGRAPYRLYWEVRYESYDAIRECLSGPDGQGNFDCDGKQGHTEIVGYGWRRHSSGGEIPPTAVQGLPAALMADLNGDGRPEAYWDNNLTLRRMDDNNRIDNPRYARSWNWGGWIYWAVREGQGQIGWPGQ
jgi:hypothetical protein